LVKATFGEKLTVDFIPFIKKGVGIGMPQTVEKNQILDSFNERSAKILIPGFIEKEYDKFCSENGLFYMGVFAGLGRVLRKGDRMSNGLITNQLFSLKKLNMIQNFLECEAQRELVITYLNLRRRKFRN
jgi:poly-gamma-glutamate synthesis protein (capsule biosynthesis protein)